MNDGDFSRSARALLAPVPAGLVLMGTWLLVCGIADALAEASAVPAVPGVTLTIETHDRKPAAAKVGKGESCFTVRSLEIEGIEVIDAGKLQTLLKPLAYHCIGNGLAKEIVAAINGAHVEEGYVTTQGYLPNQDIRTSRRLHIKIVTGRIDKVTYKEEQGIEGLPLLERVSRAWPPIRDASGPWSLAQAVSGLFDTFDDALDHFQLFDSESWPSLKLWGATGLNPGDTVTVGSVQAAADIFNKVSSNRTEAKLNPGTQPGTSEVALLNKRSDSFRLSAGYEINGTDLNRGGNTVAKRLRINAAKDNLFGINDSWSTSFASGISSNEVRGQVSVPWRRFVFAFEGGYSEQITALTKSTDLLYQSGSASGSMSYLIERQKARHTTLEAALNWRHVERHVNDYRLEPQRISSLRVGLSRVHFREAAEAGLLQASQISYGLGLTQGLTLGGASRDAARPDPAAPRAQFTKVDGTVGLAQGLRNIGVLRLDLSGQWSNHPLYSDDQLTLGSLTSVRGFTNTAAKVDRGLLLRSELAIAIPADEWFSGKSKDELPFLHDMLRSLQPYVFADFGHGRDIANQRDLTRASLGGGVRYAYGRTSFDLSLAKPIVERGSSRTKRSPEVYFSLTTKLF